jgi:hypothetical protein
MRFAGNEARARALPWRDCREAQRNFNPSNRRPVAPIRGPSQGACESSAMFLHSLHRTKKCACNDTHPKEPLMFNAIQIKSLFAAAVATTVVCGSIGWGMNDAARQAVALSKLQHITLQTVTVVGHRMAAPAVMAASSPCTVMLDPVTVVGRKPVDLAPVTVVGQRWLAEPLQPLQHAQSIRKTAGGQGQV